MTLPALIAMMVAIAGPAHPRVLARVEARARVLAPAILAEAGDLDPVLLAAIAFKESSYRLDVVGKRGEIGPAQILPDGMAKLLCVGMRLRDTRENLRCAVAILRRAAQVCGSDPARYLGLYKGHRRCGPSGYAARVLALAARAKNLGMALMEEQR